MLLKSGVSIATPFITYTVSLRGAIHIDIQTGPNDRRGQSQLILACYLLRMLQYLAMHRYSCIGHEDWCITKYEPLHT
jgi:hypothetical protein